MRGAEDDLADRRALVVHEAGRRDEPRVVERVRAAERDLLLRREEELDSGVLATLVEDAANRLEHDDDRRLVVRAEDRPGGIADDAVLADDRVDPRLGRNRVRVRAEEDRRPAVVRRRDAAVDVPRVAVEAAGGVVLVPLEPEVVEVRGDAVCDGALAPGRARKGAELEEEVDEGRRQGLLHGRILRRCSVMVRAP